MAKKDELLKVYKEKVDSFSEEQLADISVFFSQLYAKKFPMTREEAFNTLLDGLPKLVDKLGDKAKADLKRKMLSL